MEALINIYGGFVAYLLKFSKKCVTLFLFLLQLRDLDGVRLIMEGVGKKVETG